MVVVVPEPPPPWPHEGRDYPQHPAESALCLPHIVQESRGAFGARRMWCQTVEPGENFQRVPPVAGLHRGPQLKFSGEQALDSHLRSIVTGLTVGERRDRAANEVTETHDMALGWDSL